MQMIFYILAAIVFFVIVDLVPAIRARRTGYVCIYAAMITAVLVCWVLLSKGVPLPGPNAPIQAAVEFLTGPMD